MPSRWRASRPPSAGGRLTTNPPFAPTGTISAFLTICAFIRPSTSVRKSSGRSDQRRPPRATLPPRRWTASSRGEYTKISNWGFGSGRTGIWAESSLNDKYGWGLPSASVWKALVRTIARTTLRKLRRMRSSSRLGTASSASSISLPKRSAASSSRASGSRRASNSLISSRTISACPSSVRPMYVSEKPMPALAQILGDRADDRYLASGQGRAEHQSVQRVVLEVAAPDADERVVEEVSDPLGVRGIRLQAEVVDPRRRAVGGRDLVRTLVGDLRAEVLERRQDLGQEHAAGS